MEYYQERAGLFTAIASALPIAASTVYFVPKFIQRIGQSKNIVRNDDNGATEVQYEDEDGIATPESMAEYSVRIQKIIMLLTALCGFAVALSSAIRASTTAILYNAMLVGITWIFALNWVSLLFYHSPNLPILTILAVHFGPHRFFLSGAGACIRLWTLQTALYVPVVFLTRLNLNPNDSPSLAC